MKCVKLSATSTPESSADVDVDLGLDASVRAESKIHNNSSTDFGEFFSMLEGILRIENMREKYDAFKHFYEDFRSGRVQFHHEYLQERLRKNPLENPHTHIAPFSPAPVLPVAKLRQRLNHASSQNPSHISCKHTNIARALHAIAHIEYSAITLALDSAYRFVYLPGEYYADWLQVADEEFGHFFALENLLGELGARYGDFPVHATLYEAMSATQESFIYRMGVVHRGLEAKGLDANPFVLQRLHALGGGQDFALYKEIDRVFGVILADEIGHVSFGSRWWRFGIDELTHDTKSQNLQEQAANSARENLACQNPAPAHLAALLGALDHAELDSGGLRERVGDMALHERAFLGLCAKFPRFSLCGRILHTQARLQAGFSQSELDGIKEFYALMYQYKLEPHA